MRLGILCHASLGGSGVQALRLARELGRRGHEVHVICRSRPFAWTAAPGVRLHTLLDSGAPRPATVLDRTWSAAETEAFVHFTEGLCRRFDLPVLNYHYALPFGRICAELQRRMGGAAPRVVATLHGTDVTAARPGPGALREDLLRADEVTTVSHSHADLAAQRLGIAPPRVIHNFVPAEVLAAEPRELPEGRLPRVLHVSNLRPCKDPAALARTFVALRRLLDAELWVAGAGPGLAALRDGVQGAGFADSLRLLGLQADVPAILDQVDLLLMTSREESFCLSALEAQARGVPVAAFSVGGLPEVVADGESGILAAPRDSRLLARRAAALLKNPTAWAATSAAALRRAGRFSADEAVAQYLGTYRRAEPARPRLASMSAGAAL